VPVYIALRGAAARLAFEKLNSFQAVDTAGRTRRCWETMAQDVSDLDLIKDIAEVQRLVMLLALQKRQSRDAELLAVWSPDVESLAGVLARTRKPLWGGGDAGEDAALLA
jgi:hypothetical protein